MDVKISKAKFDKVEIRLHKFQNRASWTHWGRVTHICDDNLTIIGSDNGLSPARDRGDLRCRSFRRLILVNIVFTEVWQMSVKYYPCFCAALMNVYM